MEKLEKLISQKDILEKKLNNKKFDKYERYQRGKELNDIKNAVSFKSYRDFLLNYDDDVVIYFGGSVIMAYALKEIFDRNNPRSFLGKVVSVFKFLGGFILANFCILPGLATIINFGTPLSILIAKPLVAGYVGIEKLYLKKLNKKQEVYENKLQLIEKQIKSYQKSPVVSLNADFSQGKNVKSISISQTLETPKHYFKKRSDKTKENKDDSLTQ